MVNALSPKSPAVRADDIDLTKLPPDEKLAAALFVLGREDMPIPPAPSFHDIVDWSKSDIKNALQKIRTNEPRRFAKLFGAVNAVPGALLGRAIGGTFGTERAKYFGTILGTLVGATPAGLVGAAIDKVVDPFNANSR